MNVSLEILDDDLINELIPIINDHHEEVSFFNDVPLNVDWARMIALQYTGSLNLVVAREKTGVIIGYLSWIETPTLHHKNLKQAYIDAFFVCPDYRGNGVAKELIDAMEDITKANCIMFHVSMNLDFSSLLERKGYVFAEKNMFKRVS